MQARPGWLVRPLAFFLCLGCGVTVAVALIEALRPYGGTMSSSRSDLAAPLAERVNAPFPRVIREASGEPLIIPHKPQRIISQTLGTDEILLALCAPQRLVALSVLADDAHYSNVTAQAQLVKERVDADAEKTLSLHPDLIFVASYSKAELLQLLQAAHAPVVRFTHFDRLDDIKDNIRTIGYAIGEDANADALIQHMEHHLAQIQANLPQDKQPVRVVSYEPGGTTGGAHTLFDDMLQVLGVTNIAAEQGITGFRQISSEQLILWNPDVIITSADRDALVEARLQLLQDPAVAVTTAGKQQRVIVMPQHLFFSVTHYITQGIERLAQALYDEHS